MDGVAPGFFADATNNRFMLNNQLVRPQDIFALSSAAGKSFTPEGGGLLFAGANQVRRDFSSAVGEILFEGEATEAGQFTNTFSNANWSKDNATVTPNAGISPDGTNNAWKLVANAGYSYAATNSTVLSRFFSFTGSVPWVWSIFVKAAELTQFRFRNNWTGSFTTIDLTLTTNTANSIYVGNGWHRCFVIYTPPSTSTNGISYRPFAAGNADGVGGVLIYGSNIVQGSTLTSYINNDAAGSIVRTADLIPLTAAARAVLSGGSGGAVAARGVYPALAISGSRIVSCSTATNWLLAARANLNNEGQSSAGLGVALNAVAGSGAFSGGFGIATSYGASGRNLGLNAGIVASDANTFSAPDLSNISVGPHTGMQAGQVIRLRQLVGWTMTDRASAAAVQAQARVA
jgi:hypothetical protein